MVGSTLATAGELAGALREGGVLSLVVAQLHAAVVAKAVSAGMLTPLQAEQMSDAEARQLIFLPGLSTAAGT